MKKQEGIITLEILIAFAVIVMVISAVILVVFGNQTIALDTQTNSEALLLAQAEIEKAQLENYADVQNETLANQDIYGREIAIDPASVTQCGKNVLSNVTWTTEQRPLYVTLTSRLTDIATMIALGGNCDGVPPPGAGWNPPATWECDNFNPGKPQSLDVLNQIVYMTSDKAPFLYITDTKGLPKNALCSGASPHLFVNFDNSFNAGKQLNDISVARLGGKVYAFTARDTKPGELEIVDVTDIENPFSVKTMTLAGVAGANSEAFRVNYFSNRVYITTRETSGPELHIFDVATLATTTPDPALIFEIGNRELNTTVESFALAKEGSKTLTYFADDSDTRGELLVYDVTIPAAVSEVTGARTNLPGNQDGSTLTLIGNNLYFGRLSAGGSDFYIFDASDPLGATTGLPILQQANIDASVIGVAVSGPYSFLATSKANAEFQVWTSDPNSPITKINTNPFNFPNIIANGVKYENQWVYVASQGQDALRILYNGL